MKAVAGALPSVRIAAFAARAGGAAVSGVVTAGAEVALTSYGQVVEVSAIVGAGGRGGVDLIWGTNAVYGHFGIDLTGPNGGVVRVDDIVIEDVTSVFLRDLMNWVDVRDFGAKGDGVADDSAAFAAADAAAGGRRVLVSAGTYYLGSSVTLENRVQFEGTVTMPTAAILSLTRDFNLATYIDAFGGDEELAFRKAVQSLLNGADHESLDLCGRRVSVTGPIDGQAAVPNRTSFAQRRVIRNGQLRAEDTGNWTPETVTSIATYSAADPWTLTGVGNVANIRTGSLVTAAGVGREVYVRAVNVAAQEVTLSQPLSDAVGLQTYSFTRFPFLLDLTGFERLDGFELEGIEFQCNALASGVLWPASGEGNVVRNCVFSRPGHRGLVSIGDGCHGGLIDLCRFVSSEGDVLAQNRQTVAIVTNASDVKIRNCRADRFKHGVVVSGARSMIAGCHFAQGDAATSGARTAGIVVAQRACTIQISGNTIDNCHIEWTNEREPDPDYTGGNGFAGLSITGNVMVCSSVSALHSFIVVRPYGSGHFIAGMTVSGNTFRSEDVVIERGERVDTSFGQMVKESFRSVSFVGNTYHKVAAEARNPLTVKHGQNTHAQVWEVSSVGALPFEGKALQVDSVTTTSRPRNASNQSNYAMPYATAQTGSNGDSVQLIWPEPVLGDVVVVMRSDM
ncbi:right-handed parallel beta-helix repeat-containing protein [Sagittula salina]|uniref:right-handed parallel beta-helix repeat-containing protein n=1 Tax=Sagittula salina TaxID=2820268 RepID=UPI0031595D7E